MEECVALTGSAFKLFPTNNILYRGIFACCAAQGSPDLGNLAVQASPQFISLILTRATSFCSIPWKKVLAARDSRLLKFAQGYLIPSVIAIQYLGASE